MTHFGRKRGPDIDLTIEGLNRHSNRFRASAEAREPDLVASRRLMVKELATRPGGLDLLRARLDGLVTTTQLHQAYLQGSDALGALLKQAKELPLYQLAQSYLATKHNPDRIAQHLDLYVEQFDRVTAENVDRFLAGLKGAEGSTKNRYRASLSGFASWLTRNGYLDRNPITDGGVSRQPERASRMPELSAEQWQAYSKALPDESMRLFFDVLIHTGADVGEVLAIKNGDCNTRAEVPRIRFRRTKIANAQERLVPIPKFLSFMIMNHIHIMGTFDGGYDPQAPLFRHYGTTITDVMVRKAHEDARKAIGRPDLRRKDFRHLAAIAWRKAGVGIETIKERLGHSSIAMTMRYAAFRPSDEFDQKGTEEAAKLITG